MFEQVVATCLAKNPDDRFQTAHDLRLQLKWIAEGKSPTAKPAGYGRTKREAILAAVACVLALLLISFVIWWRASRPAEQTEYFSAPLPFSARDVAVSPNGHTAAVVGRDSERKNLLWIYEPGSRQATAIPNTEGANFPFWSPDGKSLGFFADGKLKKLDLSGGPPQTLCEDTYRPRRCLEQRRSHPVYSRVDSWESAYTESLRREGMRMQVTFPDRTRERGQPSLARFLPDGIHFLYLAMDSSRRENFSSVYVGSRT